MKKYQPGFFDLETRTNQLTKLGDPLVDLKLRIDWEAFRVDLVKVPEKKQSMAIFSPIPSCSLLRSSVIRLAKLLVVLVSYHEMSCFNTA